MRKLALSLLICGMVSIPVAARSQDDPPSSADDYICAFSGECGDAAANQSADEPDTGERGRPRLTATRGFSLSTTDTPARPSTSAVRPPRRAGAPIVRHRVATVTAPRQPAPPSGQRVNLRLAFETGSARLTPAAAAQARIFGQALMLPQLVNMRFRIEGHTDAVGSRARNLDLSQRRAESVAAFLVAMGVPRGRLDVRGFGPDRPLPGTSGANAQNRRVEAVRVS